MVILLILTVSVQFSICKGGQIGHVHVHSYMYVCFCAVCVCVCVRARAHMSVSAFMCLRDNQLVDVDLLKFVH